jgi:two-component system nitrate/nitrite response regulator NarL
MTAEPGQVLLVDDHPVVRRGLRAMLESEPWAGEILEAPTAAEAVRLAALHPVSLVAMDVVLPDDDGVVATQRILRVRPEARVLMLTMSNDEETAVRALRAGARGYLLKDTDPDTIVGALRTVAAGGVVLGPRIGPSVIALARQDPARPSPPFDRLTPREYEIVTRLAAGQSNARIAKHLGLQEKTIRNQLSMVFAKLGVADRMQAALLARDAGM